MASLTYFTVTGTYLASLKDSVYDVDNDPDLTPLSGVVTFTPLINTGDTITATTLTPPSNLLLVPIKATIRTGQIVTNGVTGIRLPANTAVLGLTGGLYYRVDFYEGLTGGGKTYQVRSFSFLAPTSDVTIDLVEVTPVPGQPATGPLPSSAVLSVAGRTGNIVLTPNDLSGASTIGKNLIAAADQAAVQAIVGIPTSVMEYKGVWNASANSPTLADGAGNAGDLYRVGTAGSRNLGSGSITFSVGDDVVYNGATWEKLGQVVDKASVGLGNVDNTSDAAKPVSTAQQTALDGKAQALTPTAVKTSAYTAAAGDLVPVDATAGAVPQTLPAAPADKARVAYKKIDATTNVVTINAGGSDVFNKSGGSTSLTLSLPNQALSLQYKASGGIWYAVADDLPLGQLDNRFKPRTVSVDDLLAAFDATGIPIIIPHRGAGTYMAPENTPLAYKIGAGMELGIIDGGDWQTVKDGSLIDLHDTTSTWLATRNRPQSDMTGAEVALATVNCSSWFQANYPDQKFQGSDEFFGLWGGVVVTTPEPKDARSMPILAAIIQRLGIQKSVIPNAFDPALLTAFKTIGCPHILLNLTSMPSSGSRTAHKAAGINWYGIPYDGSITPANVTTLVSEGFRVMVGTVSRGVHATQYQNWLSVKSSIAAWASDDPLYSSHVLDSSFISRYRQTSDPFSALAYYHGHQGGSDKSWEGNSARGTFRGTKRFTFTDVTKQWVLQGWACPIANAASSWTLDYNLTFDTIGSDTTRWGGVVVGVPTDRGWTDSTDAWESGYQCYFRANGQLNVSKHTAGSGAAASTAGATVVAAPLVTSSTLAANVAITSIPVTALPAAVSAGWKFRLPNDQIATVSGAGAASGATSVPVTSITPTAAVPSGSSLPQTVPLRIAVTPTTVTFSRQDGASSSSVAVTDSAFRGAYLFAGFSANGSGLSLSFSEMVVT